MLVLDAHDTASPDSAQFLVVVEFVLELLAKLIKVTHVLLADISHGNTGGCLQVA